ncbi:MAG: ribonuclease H [Candidatus Paceibacterota bacterium]
MSDPLLIYTDGSSAPNPRKGGVGMRFIFPGGEIKDFTPYGYKGATNNMMELQAPILALKEVLKINDIKGAENIVVYTDSQYVVNNYKTAMFTWPRMKWLKSNGEPVANTEQWKELLRLMRRMGQTFRVYVDFVKVKGHSGDQHNEAVDKLAKQSRKGVLKGVLSNVNVRRKITNKMTIRGSVEGEGQRLRIKIVSSEWVKSHKEYKYRFEVLSKKSKYFGNMDFAWHKDPMRVGHIFDIMLMDGLTYCRIKKIIGEVK